MSVISKIENILMMLSPLDSQALLPARFAALTSYVRKLGASNADIAADPRLLAAASLGREFTLASFPRVADGLVSSILRPVFEHADCIDLSMAKHSKLKPDLDSLTRAGAVLADRALSRKNGNGIAGRELGLIFYLAIHSGFSTKHSHVLVQNMQDSSLAALKILHCESTVGDKEFGQILDLKKISWYLNEVRLASSISVSQTKTASHESEAVPRFLN